MYIIDHAGNGDFTTINDAIHFLAALPQTDSLPHTLWLANGHYREKVIIENVSVHLIGQSKEGTIIEWQDGAFDQMPDGTKRQTFRTASFYASSDYIGLSNLTIINSAGPGALKGQAIALYLDCEKASIQECRLLGHQDTLFLAPLPPKERIPNSFVGPGEKSPRRPTYSQFTSCYIEGDIDFIFGGGKADFISCHIHSLDRGEKINGYITAASTPLGQNDGFTFFNCHLTSEADQGTVFLGRPWRPHAKVTFIDSRMDAHIHQEGWDLWNDLNNAKTVTFGERGNRGKGASLKHRPPFIQF